MPSRTSASPTVGSSIRLVSARTGIPAETLLLSGLTGLFVKTVLDFYRERGGDRRGKGGAMIAL